MPAEGGAGEAAERARVPAWAGLVAFVLAVVMSFGAGLAGGLVMMIVLVAVRGMPKPSEIEAWAMDPLVMLPSAAAGQLALLAVACLTPLVFRVRLRDALGLRPAPVLAFVVAPLGALGLGPLANVLIEALLSIAPWASLGLLEQLSDMVARAPVVALVPVVALLPGLGEELLFRGLIQRSLGGGAVAVVVASVLFASLHVDPPHVVATLPMGLYLGFLALRTKSVWVGVVAHAVNNAASIALSRVPALDAGHGTDVPMPWWWLPVGLAFTTFAVVVVVMVTRGRDAER